jgi:hypothetical protein
MNYQQLATWSEFERENIEELLDLKDQAQLEDLIAFDFPKNIDNLDSLWECQLWLWEIRKLLWPEMLDLKRLRVQIQHDGRTGEGTFPIISIASLESAPFSELQITQEEPLPDAANFACSGFTHSDWLHMDGLDSGNLFGWPGFTAMEVSYLEHDDDDDEQLFENSFSALYAILPEFSSYFSWGDAEPEQQTLLLRKLKDLIEHQQQGFGDVSVDPSDLIELISRHPSSSDECRAS